MQQLKNSAQVGRSEWCQGGRERTEVPSASGAGCAHSFSKNYQQGWNSLYVKYLHLWRNETQERKNVLDCEWFAKCHHCGSLTMAFFWATVKGHQAWSSLAKYLVPLSTCSVKKDIDFCLENSWNESRGVAVWDSLVGWAALNGNESHRNGFHAPTFLIFLIILTIWIIITIS